MCLKQIRVSLSVLLIHIDGYLFLTVFAYNRFNATFGHFSLGLQAEVWLFEVFDASLPKFIKILLSQLLPIIGAIEYVLLKLSNFFPEYFLKLLLPVFLFFHIHLVAHGSSRRHRFMVVQEWIFDFVFQEFAEKGILAVAFVHVMLAESLLEVHEFLNLG